MAVRITYPNIDMQQTGRRLKYLIESAGYTPRMIQEYLHLSCVQPIYRWYKGKILPSVDNLLMLSELLNVHMEDFLVKKDSLSAMINLASRNSLFFSTKFSKYSPQGMMTGRYSLSRAR